MKERKNGIILAVMISAVLLGCASPNDVANDPTVTLLAISGVTAPSFGAAPATSLDASQYAGTISWSPAVNGAFAASTVYTATITLSPKAGYTMTGVKANGFTVAGATSVANAADSGTVTAAFPATGSLNYVSPTIGTLVYVPAGRYQRDGKSANISEITKPYRISQYEITRAQFKAIMGVDPSDPAHSSGMNDPVQMVNWYHAIAFCNKLSLAEGLQPVYAVNVGGTMVDWKALTYADVPTVINSSWDAPIIILSNNGYRLPTETEWMWAAMGAPADGQNGGTNTNGHGKQYAGQVGANKFNDYAWNMDNSNGTTHPVGTKLPNELALYDMNGNVSEWCWDWYSGDRPDS